MYPTFAATVFFRLRSLFYLACLEVSFLFRSFNTPSEKYYQTIFYLIFLMIGIQTHAEVKTNRGRIDAVVELANQIFIFEFKLDGTAKAALKQIKETEYYRKYSLSRSKFGVFGYFQSRLQGFWSHLFRFRLQKTTYFISENRPNLTQKLDIDRQICIYVNCLARILSQNLKFGSTESKRQSA
ncbi:PD-(D/E)XK nuclease domain-containing protein [Chloroflexi bacterium TSY]|nr:PD-(D/E)XK nuclease domain-containing protein [Chloroflexi bacterium TSY]